MLKEVDFSFVLISHFSGSKTRVLESSTHRRTIDFLQKVI